MQRTLTALPVCAAVLLLGACGDRTVGPTASVAAPARSSAAASSSAVIPDRYIVVFHRDVRDPLELADRLAAAHGGKVHYRYEHALKGFAATLSPRAAEALRRNPNVDYVEQDRVAEPTTVQSGAPWGLDRVDQVSLPLNGTFEYGRTGAGVRAYVIDTGIETTHSQFGGRASVGFDAMTDGRNGRDCNGHGTHVAGILGGSTYGIAKGVSLVSVRVFDCSGTPTGSGSTSSIVAGVNWVTGNRVLPAVANMSLRMRDPSGSSTALDNAVLALINSGVTVVAGAAQTQTSTAGATTAGEDACVNSPARLPAVITVGASNASDSRVINGVSRGVTWTSNFGTCIDLFAPGDQIASSWLFGSTFTIGGTSMSTPFVAGFAARYLQANTGASPSAVTSYILGLATPNKILNAGPGSPTKLLYTGPCCTS